MRIAIEVKPDLPIGTSTEGLKDLLADIARRINEGNTSGKFTFEREYMSGWSETEGRSFTVRWEAS